MVSQTHNETVFKRMLLAICSGNRRQVLLALHQKKKSLGDLREDLNSDSPTIVRSLRELERNHIFQQDELRDYSLTVIDEALAQKVIDCHHLAEVLTLHDAFWFEHDVSGIPRYLFGRIGLLRGSTLVADTQGHVLSGLQAFVGLIEDADLLKIITPFTTSILSSS